MGGPAMAKSKAFMFAAHVLAAAAAAMVLVWTIHFRGGLAFKSANKSIIFNVHPVFMLIGFIIMASEANLSYRALPWSKRVNKYIHLILHGIALALGAVGIYAVFKFHDESGIKNLYSLHSWLGIGTICLYGIQWIWGFITFFFPGASMFLKAASLPWHVLFGIFVYLLGIVTAELGFLEKMTFLEFAGLQKYSREAILVNSTALVVVLLGGSVLLSLIAPFVEYRSI